MYPTLPFNFQFYMYPTILINLFLHIHCLHFLIIHFLKKLSYLNTFGPITNKHLLLLDLAGVYIWSHCAALNLNRTRFELQLTDKVLWPLAI